jgi:hypothetical protein
MHAEKVMAGADAVGGLAKFVDFTEGVAPEGVYKVQCFGEDGLLKWEDEIQNLVTNDGKKYLLDTLFQGSGYTQSWAMGLVDGGSAPTFNGATDTMAAHAGWTESVAYSNANRVAPGWNTATASGGGAGSAGTGSKASTATSFSINATATIAGCFLTTQNTKGGTTGILYSAGAFTGGNKAVANGDTLNVTYTAQA